MPSSAITATFFCFAAAVLLIFASISSPTWEMISFLNVGDEGSQIHFGIFGFTGSSHTIGYDFPIDQLNTTVLHGLTKTLILHPVAAGLSGIAFLFGFLGLASQSRIAIGFMTLVTALAVVVTFIAWVIDMVLFGIARQRFREAGTPAEYGNANWITLGALVVLLLGFCLSACGVFGRYDKQKRDSQTPAQGPSTGPPPAFAPA